MIRGLWKSLTAPLPGYLSSTLTVGLALAEKTEWAEVPAYAGGQFAGAFVGAVLVWLVYLPHWPDTACGHRACCPAPFRAPPPNDERR